MYNKFYLLTFFDHISIYTGFRDRVWDEVGWLYAHTEKNVTVTQYQMELGLMSE